MSFFTRFPARLLRPPSGRRHKNHWNGEGGGGLANDPTCRVIGVAPLSRTGWRLIQAFSVSTSADLSTGGAAPVSQATTVGKSGAEFDLCRRAVWS